MNVETFTVFYCADWPCCCNNLSSAVREQQLCGTCVHEYNITVISSIKILQMCLFFTALTPSILAHRFQSYLWAYPDMDNASPNPNDSRSSQFWKSRKHKMSFHKDNKWFYAIWHKDEKWEFLQHDIILNLGKSFLFMYQSVCLPKSIEVREAPTA